MIFAARRLVNELRGFARIAEAIRVRRVVVALSRSSDGRNETRGKRRRVAAVQKRTSRRSPKKERPARITPGGPSLTFSSCRGISLPADPKKPSQGPSPQWYVASVSPPARQESLER